eukprot:2145562-Prymnesium_polylepis.1
MWSEPAWSAHVCARTYRLRGPSPSGLCGLHRSGINGDVGGIIASNCGLLTRTSQGPSAHCCVDPVARVATRRHGRAKTPPRPVAAHARSPPDRSRTLSPAPPCPFGL